MLETCVDPNLEPASGLDWEKMQIYETHVKRFFDNLHGVLVQEGWASLAGEFEDSEGNGITTRAQLSLLWSYRGKVDWKTFELPFTGIEPAVFLMSGVLKNIDLSAQTDNPLKKCSLWSGAGCPGMRSYWVDVNVTRFICGALSSRSENEMSMLVHIAAQWNWKPPYSNKSSWTMCLLRFWLGCCQWFDCHVQGVGRKLGKGANFYTNTPCWNIPHVPWQHCFNSSMRSCSNRLLRSGFNGLWKLGSMSCWGSYQNQTLPQPFPTIPYHCTAGKPISGWMPLPPVRDMLDSLARILAAFCSTSRHCFHISPTLNQC